jgi:hypothetical protein
VDVTFELFKNVTNIFANIDIRFAESETDTKYQRKFFATTINYGRALEGVRGNFIISALLESFTKSADFDINLPFLTVRKFTIEF